MIFFVICVESVIKTQTAYLIYFGICYLLAILGWLVFYKYFTVMTKDEVESMRNDYNLAQKTDRPVDSKEHKEKK